MDRKTTLRPVPIIESELSFSRKKKSRIFSEISNKNPRSPMKSAPPVSRIFRNRALSTPGACAVSFRQSQIKREVNIQSPLYTDFDKLYFDQCFTCLSFLGSGSFGQVVKVQSKEDGKLYAVKKSQERFRSNSDRKQHLEEVNKNEQIQVHPNCVRFFKAWEECDHLYIQTELCEMSLKDYAESVQMIEEKEIWNIIVDLCNGLKHLHDVQLAHMDIKPANLFLGRDGLYKIGDFGLVVELTRDLSDAMDGDSKYMAPELMEGKFSKAADIFSLGIAILELACSLELPHGGSLWHELRNNKLPLEFTQGLSDDLILLVSTMMDRNPENRPTVKDIINKPSVIEAKQTRQNESRLTIFLHPFFYFIKLLFQLFSFLFNLFKEKANYVRYRARTPPPLFNPLSNSMANYNLCNMGHESLHDDSVDDSLNETSGFSPIFNHKDGAAISPLFKRSPLFQPVSNKKEVDTWKITTPEMPSLTPRSYSTPHPEDCSPSLSPISDRIVRSRLFTCSDDEEIFESHSLSTNLMKTFED